MIVAREQPRDYSRIYYYIDANNEIWHGPFCRLDNVHWKKIDSDIVTHSSLPSEAVEISPYQAAQEIRRRQERDREFKINPPPPSIPPKPTPPQVVE